MPRWNFFLVAGLLSEEEKESVADQITQIYTRASFPKFWVNVIFEEQPSGNFYNGGKSDSKSIFFYISHAARSFESEEERLEFHDFVDKIVRPVFEPKGLEWEYNIYSWPSSNWRITGMEPPLPNGDDPESFKLWREQNKAVPYGKYLKN